MDHSTMGLMDRVTITVHQKTQTLNMKKKTKKTLTLTENKQY